MLWQRATPHLNLTNTFGPVEASGKGFNFDLVSFNIVMLAWSKQQSWEGAEEAHKWLRLIGIMGWNADSYSYGACLTAYAKANSIKAAIAAEELLEQYISTVCLTTDSLHNAVMDAWARSGHKGAGSRAYAILKELESHPTVKPSTISYNTCIKAFANTGEATRAEELLEELKSNRTDPLSPNKVSYTTCINAWATVTKTQQQHRELQGNTKRIEAISRIRRLLSEMETTYNSTKDKRIQPDLYTYTAALSAQALQPLEIYKRINKYGDKTGFPNVHFLNSCIHVMAQALERRNNGGDVLASDDSPIDPATTAQVAETLLRQMQQQETFGKNSATTACKVTFSSVISCWAQVGTEAAAQRAENLLDELQDRWEATNKEQFLPSAKTFCSVLTAWIKVASTEGSEGSSIVDRAIGLEKRMHQLYKRTKSSQLAPNRIIFIQLFQLLAKSNDPEAALKARDLLKMMEFYAKSGHPEVRPDATTLGSFLNALSKNNVENIQELASVVLEQVEEGYNNGLGHLKPNSLLYSSVLQAYAKSASKEGAALAEQLLERTIQLWKEGKLYAKPTVLFYNAAIDANARCNGGLKSAERAEELLSELWARAAAGDNSLKPTTRSYNAVLLAWKNSNVEQAPERAEALLNIMTERFKRGEGDCQPDTVTFNSILALHAKSSRADGAIKARKLLIFMENQCNTGEIRVEPDRISYNICITAFDRRGDELSATEIFERMLRFNTSRREQIAPDQITLGCLRAPWTKSTLPDAQSQIARIDRLIEALRLKQTHTSHEELKVG